MVEATALERIAEQLAPRSRVLRAWRLEGGTSARLTALELRTATGATRRFVVREHGGADLAAKPRVAAHEHELLARLAEWGIDYETQQAMLERRAAFVAGAESVLRAP